ncbi:nuclear pore and COPII coat complex component secretory 13 isoform X2 [Rhodnius prolixus]|uniref:Protein SEC13 homolog n=3 Tax=Rhodnius TaxID=13248 RepID=T1HNR9_RHOPR
MVSLMSVVDTSHDDVIHDAAVDFYGSQLATCSSDNVVKIFNVKGNTYSHVADLKGHFAAVWQVSWAHPKFGNILASCSYDKRVIVWKENREWTKMHDYKNHDGSVNCVSFGPPECGLTFACGSADGSMSVVTFRTEHNAWETRRIVAAHKLGVNALSWAPYVSLIPMFSKAGHSSKSFKRIVSAGCDCLIKIWVEVNGIWEEMVQLPNHSDWIRDVAWAPSTSIPCAQIASACQDKKVIIWSSVDDIKWIPYELPSFEDVVWSVSWSPTGNILAVSEGNNKVTVWKKTCAGDWTCVSEVAGDVMPNKSVFGDDCYRPED